MENFIKNFKRNPDGSWTCIAFAELRTVMGRIQVAEGTHFYPGTVFMAVDICQILDETQDALGSVNNQRNQTYEQTRLSMEK